MPYNVKTYFTASLRAEPALNVGTFDSGIEIGAFVSGLIPVRAARVLTANVPKPTIETLSPSASASLTESKTADTEDDITIPGWMIPDIKKAILTNELAFMIKRPSDDSNNSTLASVKPNGPQDKEE